jgi:pimeloyl-ACP methyl ester carboxylesterase
MTEKTSPVHDELTSLYQELAGGHVSRRDFMKRSAALGVAGAAASALGALDLGSVEAAQAAVTSATKALPLDVAEWSYMWVNVKRADTARGSYIGGQQMYVEYMIPTRVRHPFPIVLVHGGGGQGLDWMGTPDGRPGWYQHLVAEGYKVYVVDRPGHGRSPQHSDLLGAIPQRPGTMEGLQGIFIYPAADNPSKFRKGHDKWPGKGVPGAEDVAQFLASQGGSYVVVPQPPGAGGRGRGGGPAGGPPAPANQAPATPNGAAIAHATWREAGADLLDKIGPAIIMTHSAGGPFGLLVAEARPNLVKATVIIEGAGSGFSGGNRWGISTIPVTYDPPVADASEIKVRWVANPEPDVAGYFLQEEPVRRLPNLRNTAVLFVTAPNSGASPGNPGGPAFLKQAGVRIAEEYRLGARGIQGNSHMMMVETNHREVLQPILEWLDKNVNTGSAPAIKKRGTESTALRLADTGFFWVGGAIEKRDYGTVVNGQTYVQFFIPEVVRQPLPIVLVHGGGGQSTHYMGLNGDAGWAHYYIQSGYKVYLIDRPGHGRSPVSVDNLGQLGPLPLHAGIVADTLRAARGTPKRWPGATGDLGDPLVDQFIAGQNAAPANADLMQRLWRRGGAQLLDKIGPAIVQTHSAGGPYGWHVADERPAMVKALVSFEGGGAPLVAQGGAAATLLPKLKGIPMMYLTAENSGRTAGPAIVQALNASGAVAEHINLKDKGITGNGHFAMVETNRKEVFEVIRTWVESKVPPAVSQTARG